MNSNALCPEYAVYDLIPPSIITVATFDDGLPDIAMASLNYTISLRVIWRNANRVNPIFAREFVNREPIRGPVVSYDFCDWTPSAEEFFENESG
jgi:hypothetical protein